MTFLPESANLTVHIDDVPVEPAVVGNLGVLIPHFILIYISSLSPNLFHSSTSVTVSGRGRDRLGAICGKEPNPEQHQKPCTWWMGWQSEQHIQGGNELF